jgi:short-subunit dehydrogenase
MPERPWTYRDRWALITGASSGIGAVFARALAERGMHLILTARRGERLRKLAGELRDAHGVEVRIAVADLAEPGAAADLWERVDEPVHLLVNNAGFGLQGRFEELPRDRQRAMVNLNCGAVLELAHLALGPMRERGAGGIVNVASLAAFQPIPLFATYAASKAFVLSLSEALWEENRRTEPQAKHREAGVRVLALCPGPTPTEFHTVAGTSRMQNTPGTRSPEEVVRAALEALEKGKSFVVPGATNRAGSILGRLAPLGLATKVARRVMEQVGGRAPEAS